MDVEQKLELLGLAIGSKVVMVGEDPNGVIDVGEVGAVCDYHKYSDGCDIGVEWAISRRENHNCFGKCKNKHGRYVPHGSISLVDLDLGELSKSEFSISTLFDITS